MTALPLPALLSQALVAFTIEFDNEFEHRMPHRTTNHESGHGPWLVSLVMWSTCMRFVTEEGILTADLEKLARTKTNLNGMQRWGYITVDSAKVIRPTRKGYQAQQIWRPLFDEIETRWRARFGNDRIEHLQQSLAALVNQFENELPDCLPILHYGLFSPPPQPEPAKHSALSLYPLFSRALLAFALEFETESEISLAVASNIIRVLGDAASPVPLRDLPQLSGVSKESIKMALGFLRKKAMVILEARSVRLTAKGQDALESYRRSLTAIETRWSKVYGPETIASLRAALESLPDKLFTGLTPYPDNWRASIRVPSVLPHFPMVLHRGAFPDGS